jgi:hypothetical protein
LQIQQQVRLKKEHERIRLQQIQYQELLRRHQLQQQEIIRRQQQMIQQERVKQHQVNWINILR